MIQDYHVQVRYQIHHTQLMVMVLIVVLIYVIEVITITVVHVHQYKQDIILQQIIVQDMHVVTSQRTLLHIIIHIHQVDDHQIVVDIVPIIIVILTYIE
jgi:hypothetical protein